MGDMDDVVVVLFQKGGTKMNVTLIAHTQLSNGFADIVGTGNCDYFGVDEEYAFTSGEAVALTAIRTCYSPNKPSEIITKEGAKYFGKPATDGKGGSDADRLFRHIVNSGHTSTLEHLSFTFAIEGVSRALLAQLTRHRVGFSFSVQSQRYVRFGSDDKTGGFDYVVPESVEEKGGLTYEKFCEAMEFAQEYYDMLRHLGVPPEDARMVLPNAVATNLVMTANLRALLDFYSKRRKGRGAQAEIAELAEKLREAVVAVEPWTDAFFEQA
jgi:thymidylate synthase (FAD)